MNRAKILAVAACAAVLAGCASTRAPSIAKMLGDSTGQNGRACIKLHDIQGYGVLEGNIISIDSVGRNYYLATVLPGCTDLQTSARTLFSGNFGEICGQSMDTVTAGGSNCTVNKIYEFGGRDEAFAAYNEVRQKRKELKNDGPAG